MNSRKTANIALAFMLAALAACDAPTDEQRMVGLLESDRVELTAEVSEPILHRAVVEGEEVAEGQLLIEQDTGRIEARIAEAKAAQLQAQARLDEMIRGPRRELIVAAQADVRGTENDLDFRTKEYIRAREIYDKNLGSAERLDRASAARDAAAANLDSARARLEELLTGTTPEELRQAEEAVSQTDARLSSLAIDLQRHSTTAPVPGVIDSLLFETGERPVVGQPIAILLPGVQPHARIYIPEAVRVAVAPGTSARVFVDGLSEPLQGRVRWVASEAAFTPYFALTERDRGRLTYAAKVDILNAEQRLPDGIPVEVELLIGQATQ
jgi:HlyD family secretion protein